MRNTFFLSHLFFEAKGALQKLREVVYTKIKPQSTLAVFLAMAKTGQSINLLPNKRESLLSQFLTWTLTIGRLLIIITETLALGTFLYRFSLDMRIIDLRDQIKAESFIVKNFAAEESFRNLQDRLTLAKAYGAPPITATTIFQDIAELGQGNVTFLNLMVSGDTVKIEIQAPSTKALSTFVNALKAYPEVTSITIDEVANKTSSSLIMVTITAMLKNSAQPAFASQQTPADQPIIIKP